METKFFCRIFLVFFCRNPVGRDMMAVYCTELTFGFATRFKTFAPEVLKERCRQFAGGGETSLVSWWGGEWNTRWGAKDANRRAFDTKTWSCLCFLSPQPVWFFLNCQHFLPFPLVRGSQVFFFLLFCALSFLGVELGETRRRPAKPKNSWSHVVPNTIVEPLWWQNAHFRTFSSFGEGKKVSTQKRSNPPIFARTLGWIKLLAFLNTALFSLYLLSNSFLIIFAEFSFPCGVPLYNGLQGSRQL